MKTFFRKTSLGVLSLFILNIAFVACKKDKVSLATVTTSELSNITANSAKCGGDIKSDGGGTILESGICWSKTQEFDLNTSLGHTTDGIQAIGVFSSNLTSLTPNSPYYVRAYVKNTAGIAYGEAIFFTTALGPPSI